MKSTKIGMVSTIPQDTWWNRSFNVLIPLEIQGKECEIVEMANPPTIHRGSQNAHILVEGKSYGIPGWAVTPIAIRREFPVNYVI